MELRETYEVLVAKLIEDSKKSLGIDDFCLTVVETLSPELVVDAIVFVFRLDEATFDCVYIYNRSYALLDQGRYLKINRRTPLTDAINLQKVQAWGSSQRIIREYPESITWPIIPHSVVAVPIVVGSETIAGCVFGLKEEFSIDEKSQISDALESISALVYQVYERTH